MRIRVPFSGLLAAWLVASCSSTAPPDAAAMLDTGASDADSPTADAGARVCADPLTTFALPTPAWGHGATLTPPDDLAVRTLRMLKPAWASHLAELDGWPRRPILVVPIEGRATAVDASRIALFDATGAVPVRLDAEVDAQLVSNGTYLVARPRLPLPPAVEDVVVAFGAGALTAGRALPVCEGAAPHPGYAETLALLPAGAAELALRLRISSAPSVLAKLHTRLVATPALTVASLEARTLASFGDLAPPAETAAALRPSVAYGVLSLPDYRDATGAFALDAQGAPRATGTTEPNVLVVLPQAGAAPYPVVLYQHGGGQAPTDVFALGHELADAGLAFVAIDLPGHGHRSPTGAGGGDLDFLDFEEIVRTRGNFQQAVADHMTVITGMGALNAALAPVLGTGPTTLDAGRVFYMGMSLGGVSGTLTYATTPELRAAALFVGGGGYPELVATGLFSALVGPVVSRPAPQPVLLLELGAALLDGAEPLSFVANEDRARAPRPVLFFQAVGDPLIPLVASDQWARAYGASLALPRDHAFPGLTEVTLPHTGAFTWPGGTETATRLLVQAPMTGVAPADKHGQLVRERYSQRLVARCFRTLLDTGRCEAIDTGFSP